MVDLIERGKALIAHFPDTEKCAICNTQIEVQLHHIWPRHLGGPQDGPLIAVCSKHHLMLHHLTGKNKEIPTEENYTTAQTKLIKMLVQFINIAKIQYEDTDKTWIDRKVVLTIPDALLKRAHKRKADSGFSNLPDYITSLLIKDTLTL